VIPDFFGCLSGAAGYTTAGVIHNCLSGNGSKAAIVTYDYCQGSVVPSISGSNLGEYQWTFDFTQDHKITVGHVLGSPLRVQVEGATCNRWESNNDYFVCPLLGPGGVFDSAETALVWLEHPEPGLGDIGHRLNWSIEYSQPFGPQGSSCRQTAFSKQGTMELFSLVELRDHVETIVPNMKMIRTRT
jgi:hypothetical protein